MKEIFPGIFRDGSHIYTHNLVKGKKVYGEQLFGDKREWIPERSKLGAAILNGLRDMPIKPSSIVLYLGASTGTTVSHVSDIVGKDGFVYGIEFAERVLRNLIDLANQRKNIAAINADARKTEEYKWIEECDVVFCDVADIQEIEIFIKNCNEFLKDNGYGMLSIKSQSIDVTKDPKEIYKTALEKLNMAHFKVIQFIELDPYEKHHGFVLVKK